jgi:hypothetical protein
MRIPGGSVRTIVALATLLAAGRAGAGVAVGANMDLYRAGGNATSAGDPPLETAIVVGPGWVLRFPSVTGSTDCHALGDNCLPTGPDGNFGADVIVPTQNKLSGIDYRGNFSLPLMGVFLGASLPDAAPAPLDFRNAEAFARVDPALGQIFWIGDGLTGTGSGDVQVFGVPEGTTRLVMGFIDPVPGDNAGELSVAIEIAPEPASSGLALGAIAALYTLTRGRKEISRCCDSSNTRSRPTRAR